MIQPTRLLTRRRFLKGSVAASLAISCWPRGTVLGANERIGVAVIGTGGRGSGHVGQFNRGDANIVGLCDADQGRMEGIAKKLGGSVACHQDLRKILDMKEVDAVVIATPNHWHAPAAILACQAGKDVYVEKPVAHCIWEGRQMVKAARKYNRIVQAGTQQRSDPYYAELKGDLKAGKYGEIKLIHALKCQVRPNIGKVSGPQPVPAGIDYNLWCGPASNEPPRRKKFHYDWHWQYNWGDGEMGNWGPHVVDDLRNILDWDDVPGSMVAAGGRFCYDDDADTPNMQMALFDHKGFKVVVDIRDLPLKKGVNGAGAYMRSNGHLVIVCEKGTIRCGRGGGRATDDQGALIKQYKGTGGSGHDTNFLKAVKSRNVQDLNCDIEVGFQSTMMCLLANVAFRIGKQATLEQAKAAMKEHPDALDTLDSYAKQVADNEGDMKDLMLGPKLTFDTKTERFTGANADEANKMLRYEMRKEFAVPEEV